MRPLQQAPEGIPADRPHPVEIPALLNDEAGVAKALLEQFPRVPPEVAQIAIEIGKERRVGGHEDHDDAARLDRAIQLRQDASVILDVLEHIQADDGVNPVAGEVSGGEGVQVDPPDLHVLVSAEAAAQQVQVFRLIVGQDDGILVEQEPRQIAGTRANLEHALAK